MSLVKIANKFLNDNRVDKQTYISLASQRMATSEIGGTEAMYALYDSKDNLLYIGWARYIAQRLGAHFVSYTNTQDIKHRIAYAKYTFRLNQLRNEYNKVIQLKHPEVEVFDLEYCTIKTLNPPYNKVRSEDRLLKSIYEEAY
jgi:excinuclease UvrABC nuclease subunit